jgi:hypothetical protein
VDRREYKVHLRVNNRSIHKVVIDPHYELRHSESIDDQTILALVKQLDGRIFLPIKRQGEFEYFVEDKMKLKKKLYKLVWLLHDDEVFIGVVNCYRRD